MSVTRLSTVTQNKISSSSAVGDFQHTVDAGTDLLILVVAVEGKETVTATPDWDRDGTPQALTVIRDTGGTGSDGDIRTYVYGLVNPNEGTDYFDIALSNVNPGWCLAINYSGTHALSVADATDYLSEDVNAAGTTTTVLASGGASDDDFQFCVAEFQGNDGSPAADGLSWSEVIDDTTGTSDSADFAVAFYDTTDAFIKNTTNTITWSASDENTGVRVRINGAPEFVCSQYNWVEDIDGAAHESWSYGPATPNAVEDVELDEDWSPIIKVYNVNPSIAAIAASFKLQYNVDSAGWFDVTSSSSNVRITDSGDTDDATSSTRRTTAEAPNFYESRLDEVNGIVVGSIPADWESEYYYALNFRSAELSGGERIVFQILADYGIGYAAITHNVNPTVDVVAAGGVTADGTPSIDELTASGAAVVRHIASGTPSISELTASGTAKIVRTATAAVTIAALTAAATATAFAMQSANGTPSIDELTASGGAVVRHVASGTPAIDELTASGSATVKHIASGTPAIDELTASGTTQIVKLANGTPALLEITASGVTIVKHGASGTPSIDELTASGTAQIAKLASGTLAIDELTASGAAVVRHTASGTPFIDELIADGSTTIVGAVTANGTPSIGELTASGSAQIVKLASGTPAIDELTASGSATVKHIASGTPAIDELTASGTTQIVKLANGTPAIDELTASGAAVVRHIASGTPSVDELTASGVAVVKHTASGTPSIDELTASGTADVLGQVTANGTPAIDELTASGVAVVRHIAFGTPSIDEVTASGTVSVEAGFKPAWARSSNILIGSGLDHV